MTDISNLIAELERADGPAYVLDSRIHDATVPVKFRRQFGPRAYTASLDAARSLIPLGYSFAVGNCGEENTPWARVTAPDPDSRHFDCRSAASEAIALTIAALKASAA